MLSQENYTVSNIERLARETKGDKVLLERMLMAFGLLEALRRTKLPFVFKGGTSLLLLLDKPHRLSTDIDILVEPGIDVEPYVQQASHFAPLNGVTPDERAGKGGIEKQHFKFDYQFPSNKTNLTVLLDVVFEHNRYHTLIDKPIKNNLLLTEGEDLLVQIPSIDDILGDKLTAFAPYTTGVLLGSGKDLEIVKQLFDCGNLFDAATDFDVIKQSYRRVVEIEIGYRGLTASPDEVLKDTITACVCIISLGSKNPQEYNSYRRAFGGINNHVADGHKFNAITASSKACRVLYLATTLLTKQKAFKKIADADDYNGQTLTVAGARRYRYLQADDPIGYCYLLEAARLLDGVFDPWS